jgi:hypothetical protein
VGKGCRRVNIVQILCVHMYVNRKMLKLFHEWHRRIKGNMEVNSSMIYLIYCKNFCKCHNVPLGQQKKK